MSEVDLGQVKMTDAELMNFILQFNGGVRLGKDENGNAGYIATDEETGADTVIPFSSGGSGGFSEMEIILLNNYSTTYNYSTIQMSNVTYNFTKKFKRVLIFMYYEMSNSRYNKPTAFLFNQGSTSNPEIKEISRSPLYKIGNFFAGGYVILNTEEVPVNGVLNFSIGVSTDTSTSNSAQKTVHCIVCGIN